MRILLSLAIAAVAVSHTPAFAAELKKSEDEAVKRIVNKMESSFESDDEVVPVLKGLLTALGETSKKVKESQTVGLYKQFLAEESKELIERLVSKSAQRQKWVDIRDAVVHEVDVLVLDTEEVKPKNKSDQPTKKLADGAEDVASTQYRAVLRRIVEAAARVELFRRDGMSNDDLEFMQAIQRILQSKKFDDGKPGPFLDSNQAQNIKRLLEKVNITDELEETAVLLQDADNASDFEAIIDSRIKPFLAKIADENGEDLDDDDEFNLTNIWKLTFEHIKAELATRADGDMDRYRELLKGPLKRAFELELLSAQEMLTAQGPQAFSNTNPGRATTNTSSRSSNGRRSRPCCLGILFGISPNRDN